VSEEKLDLSVISAKPQRQSAVAENGLIQLLTQ